MKTNKIEELGHKLKVVETDFKVVSKDSKKMRFHNKMELQLLDIMENEFVEDAYFFAFVGTFIIGSERLPGRDTIDEETLNDQERLFEYLFNKMLSAGDRAYISKAKEYFESVSEDTKGIKDKLSEDGYICYFSATQKEDTES